LSCSHACRPACSDAAAADSCSTVARVSLDLRDTKLGATNSNRKSTACLARGLGRRMADGNDSILVYSCQPDFVRGRHRSTNGAPNCRSGMQHPAARLIELQSTQTAQLVKPVRRLDAPDRPRPRPHYDGRRAGTILEELHSADELAIRDSGCGDEHVV
jgi:hypothetical protein